MDWSLFQRKSLHPFLRPELLYDRWWRVSALGTARGGYLADKQREDLLCRNCIDTP